MVCNVTTNRPSEKHLLPFKYWWLQILVNSIFCLSLARIHKLQEMGVMWNFFCFRKNLLPFYRLPLGHQLKIPATERSFRMSSRRYHDMGMHADVVRNEISLLSKIRFWARSIQPKHSGIWVKWYKYSLEKSLERPKMIKFPKCDHSTESSGN